LSSVLNIRIIIQQIHTTTIHRSTSQSSTTGQNSSSIIIRASTHRAFSDSRSRGISSIIKINTTRPGCSPVGDRGVNAVGNRRRRQTAVVEDVVGSGAVDLTTADTVDGGVRRSTAGVVGAERIGNTGGRRTDGIGGAGAESAATTGKGAGSAKGSTAGGGSGGGIPFAGESGGGYGGIGEVDGGVAFRTAEFFALGNSAERGKRIGREVGAAADDAVLVRITDARNEVDRDGCGTGCARTGGIRVAGRAGTAFYRSRESVEGTAAGNLARSSGADKSLTETFVRHAADYRAAIDRAGGSRTDDGRKSAGRTERKIKFAAYSGGSGSDVGKTKVADD
jgi:hypothetical protein